ncbi:hypothetical protein [Fumia xinanensis]|uniref:Uncharacterized protein n=1 Tax=Fumia xinanensis TaxID=2763659 RepID=A0A926I6D0_9FIRM|nr:hypothetical protein [Fumia xinanensis]MBC8558721.1 hypothetical protein [Fumia xinanensis]
MKNKLDPIGVLSESIIKYIKEALSSASFDKTQKGIITETLSDNRYKVKIAQAAYTVPAVISGSYAVGDEVYVIVPQNDPDQMFLLPVGISELDPSTTVLSVNGKTGYVNLGIPDIPNLNTELNNRVVKETGKGLSTHDYTTAEKQKLAGIAQNANNYVHPSAHPASMITGLSSVATSGAYEDLAGKPSLKTIATSGNAQDVTFSPPSGVTATDVQTALTELNAKADGKVDKVTGKGLSTNDYTAAEKQKLAGIAPNANNYTHPSAHPASMIQLSDGKTLQSVFDEAIFVTDWNDAVKPGMYFSLSDAANEPPSPVGDDWFGQVFVYQGRIKQILTHASSAPIGIERWARSWWESSQSWSAWSQSFKNATSSSNGLMSSTDKTKLDGVEANANNFVHPTTSGNKHIPSGGTDKQILRWDSDGTAVWDEEIDAYTKEEARQQFANVFVGKKSGQAVTLSDVCESTLLQKAAVQGATTEVLANPEAEKSPDNIATISGTEPTALTVCGKNLFDMDNCFPGDTRVYRGITYEKTPDGILVNGTATAQSYTTPHEMAGILKVGKTYTVSINDQRAVPVMQINKDTGTIYARTYTVTGDETGIDVYFYFRADTLVDNLLVQFQLEEGSTPTAYEPYSGTDYPLPTLEALMSLPNGVCDEYDAVTGVETRRIGKMVLDGTETFTVGTHSNGQAYASFVIPVHAKADSLPVSTHYLASQWTNLNNRIYVPSYMGFVITDSRFVSKDAATEILAAQHAAGTPVTVYYELAEPVITQHTPTAILAIYPTTTVYSDQGNISVTYNRDSNQVYGELTDSLMGKVDKEIGKGLSTNDYTAAEKQKLAGIAQNANNYTHPSTHPASMVVFSDGHTFQQKLDQGELKGDKGDSFKVGETYDTAIEKTFFFKLMP